MKLILDLDTGIDDAMALAYAVGSDKADLIGVVGTYGNVITEEGVKNVLNLLAMLGRTNIPVYMGESCATTKDTFNRLEISAKIHGQNGVGEVSVEASERIIEVMSGVDYLIEAAKKYGKDLTIVATGPMTNLATALKKEPTIASMIGHIVIMGGALTVPGNVTSFAEANIFQDPEAAKHLFESSANITMVGLDVTMRSVLRLEDTQKWRETNTVAGRTYADMVDYYIHIHDEIAPYLEGCPLHDPSAVAAALNSALFTTLPLFMTVDTEGNTRARTIAAADKIRDENPNVKVCIAVHSKELLNDLNNTLLNLFSNK